MRLRKILRARGKARLWLPALANQTRLSESVSFTQAGKLLNPAESINIRRLTAIIAR